MLQMSRASDVLRRMEYALCPCLSGMHAKAAGTVIDLKLLPCRLQGVGDWYYGKWMKRFYMFYALLMVAAVITFGPICGVIAAGVLLSQQLPFKGSTSSRSC